jgi:hypothetical protein
MSMSDLSAYFEAVCFGNRTKKITMIMQTAIVMIAISGR